VTSATRRRMDAASAVGLVAGLEPAGDVVGMTGTLAR